MSSSDSASGRRTAAALVCLFLSGLCALIYQSTWLREFRLVFGASTPASAAVLGIFMGGVGAGSLVLGRKVDRLSNPFRYYGGLELLIALSAALTPLLLTLVRAVYLGVGGTLSLGLIPGTVMRLILATLVLLVPTFLMGGTLPALARTFQSETDGARRRVAALYAVNTFGAVVGAVLATFFLFERFGNRMTLWTACTLNFIVALTVLALSGTAAGRTRDVLPAQRPRPEETTHPPAPRRFVFAAAVVAGFVFFLMELVWYRMLAPLLGGSTFTFGLILAITLAGIGAGSFLYSLRPKGGSATLAGFATVCSLEALFMALPYALGDQLALLAILLQPFGALGFAGRVVAWSAVTVVVVFPAALVAGFQFPMLIGLLGRGRAGVGADTGSAYLWNTAGAITGSLAGGFGLLPLLSAPGAWRLAVLLLVLLGLAAAVLAVRAGCAGCGRYKQTVAFRTVQPLGISVATLLLLTAAGPTAAWRHAPIGAGRVRMAEPTLNDFEEFVRARRRLLLWEAEGRESSVGVTRENSLAFLVNGKADGNAREDAPTQVLCGLLGALLHPNPTRGLVIGLGTGSSAGWLGRVPGIDRVDVVELEPAMREVARLCAPVNENVLENPKVRLIIGDAREVIQVSRDQYDVIASEPSNPYRAGVASLFSKEFYSTVASRLRPGGIFVQWVQAYEVDGHSIATVLATLHAVFQGVEIWQTKRGDLMFIASAHPIVHELSRLRARIGEEPYKSALAAVWRVTDAEGVFARFVANSELAAAVAARQVEPITDDRNTLEFAFARTVGRKMRFGVDSLRRIALEEGWDLPKLSGGSVDWVAVMDRTASALALDSATSGEVRDDNEQLRARLRAKEAYAKGDLGAVFVLWFEQPGQPRDLLELAMVTECLAECADERVHEFAGKLRAWQPGEADAALARYWWRKGQTDQAVELLASAFQDWRQNPWALESLMGRTLELAETIAISPQGVAHARGILAALHPKFSVFALDIERTLARLEIGRSLDPGLAGRVLSEFEPDVPWSQEFLEVRASLYRGLGGGPAAASQQDLEKFLRGVERPFPYADRETLEAVRSSAQPPSGLDWTVHARELE